jgi:hypothetical protein
VAVVEKLPPPFSFKGNFMGYIFRNKQGHFSKPSMRGKVYNDHGKQLGGAVKESVVSACRRKNAKRSARHRKINISVKTKSRQSGIRTAVPRNLTPSFKWFVENAGKIKANDKRPLYAIIELSGTFTYKSEERQEVFKKNYLVPLLLTQTQRGKFLKGKLTPGEILTYARRRGIAKAAGIHSVVVKKPMKAIRKNSYLNPLLTDEQKKTIENKRRNTKRKRYQ